MSIIETFDHVNLVMDFDLHGEESEHKFENIEC